MPTNDFINNVYENIASYSITQHIYENKKSFKKNLIIEEKIDKIGIYFSFDKSIIATVDNNPVLSCKIHVVIFEKSNKVFYEKKINNKNYVIINEKSQENLFTESKLEKIHNIEKISDQENNILAIFDYKELISLIDGIIETQDSDDETLMIRIKDGKASFFNSKKTGAEHYILGYLTQNNPSFEEMSVILFDYYINSLNVDIKNGLIENLIYSKNENKEIELSNIDKKILNSENVYEIDIEKCTEIAINNLSEDSLAFWEKNGPYLIINYDNGKIKNIYCFKSIDTINNIFKIK